MLQIGTREHLTEQRVNRILHPKLQETSTGLQTDFNARSLIVHTFSHPKAAERTTNKTHTNTTGISPVSSTPAPHPAASPVFKSATSSPSELNGGIYSNRTYRKNIRIRSLHLKRCRILGRRNMYIRVVDGTVETAEDSWGVGRTIRRPLIGILRIVWLGLRG